MRWSLPLVLAALLAAPACSKEAPACEAPATIAQPMLEGPTASEPRRLVPIGGYTLAISWSPQYCANRSTSPRDHFQCGGGQHFGFTLHGLWPDGEGRDWPQYCRPTRLVPDKVIRQHLCSTPSPQLIQHEWEKHGTCMAETPASYFARSAALFGKTSNPDMSELRGRSMTAGTFQQAFADANPGMRPEQVRLNVSKAGWLEEVWLCLDKQFRSRACPATQGGAPADQVIRIR